MQFKYIIISRARILGGSAFSGVGAGIEHQAMNHTCLEPGRIQQCLHFVDVIAVFRWQCLWSPAVSAMCFCAAVYSLDCARSAGSGMLYASCQRAYAANRGPWYGLMHADVQTSASDVHVQTSATAAALLLLLLAAPQVSSWSSFWPLFLRVLSSSHRSDL